MLEFNNIIPDDLESTDGFQNHSDFLIATGLSLEPQLFDLQKRLTDESLEKDFILSFDDFSEIINALLGSLAFVTTATTYLHHLKSLREALELAHINDLNTLNDINGALIDKGLRKELDDTDGGLND